MIKKCESEKNDIRKVGKVISLESYRKQRKSWNDADINRKILETIKHYK